jgi:CheY-like chemotaxis protein
MAISILVVDAAPHFATLVRQTLEETRVFQACVASSAKEALELFRSGDMQLVIVDFDLPDMPGADLVKELRSSRPDLPVIGIPVGSETPELLDALGLNGILKKPFYLPDLLDLVGQALGRSETAGALAPRRPGPIQPSATQPIAFKIPPWLATQDEAAKRLTEWYPKTSGLGIVLSRGRAVWASAGRLDKKQLAELSAVLGDLWASEGMYGSLAKYVRLPSSQEELMVYATPIAGEFVLALVSSADATFSQIRREAVGLTKSLTEGGVGAAEAGGAVPGERVEHLPGDWQPREPRSGEAVRGLVTYAVASESEAQAGVSATTRESDSFPLPQDWIPSAQAPAAHPTSTEAEAAAVTPPPPARQPASEAAPAPAGEFPIPCTIILRPRSSRVELSGDLSERLAEWTASLSEARGWKVEGIAVQPEFLCFTVTHLPEPARRSLIEEMCSALSGKLAEGFRELAKDVPAGRIWATRFLLLKGGPYSTGAIARLVQEAGKSTGPLPS